MASIAEAVPGWNGLPSSIHISGPTLTASREGPHEAPEVSALGSFSELDVSLDRATRTYWCMMRPDQPCFQPSLLRDLRRMQASLGPLYQKGGAEDPPIRYFVVGSHAPGVFNLGGDLRLFKALIRSGDRQRLRDYARCCIDVVYNNAVSYGLPIITLAMVQGDALGGGFEAALSCNLIVAERSAKFGLPEILFNLFPGMGAYSFLARRLGSIAAEKMILSGKIYDAEELHALGVIDLLVDDGEAPAAVRSYISRHSRRHFAERSLYRVRQAVEPIRYQELLDVTEIWVDAALRLSESDLRKMERITYAQDRRWAARHSGDAGAFDSRRPAS